MHRSTLALAAAAPLLLVAALIGSHRDATESRDDTPANRFLPAASPTTMPADDEPCTSACRLGVHEIPVIDGAGFDDLVGAYALEPMSAESPALEALLFHDVASRAFLAERGAPGLDAERRAFLERELRRTRVRVEFRLVDERGHVHERVGPHVVPLNEKQHLAAHDAPPELRHEFNGTVKRVGLAHMWTRW